MPTEKNNTLFYKRLNRTHIKMNETNKKREKENKNKENKNKDTRSIRVLPK